MNRLARFTGYGEHQEGAPADGVGDRTQAASSAGAEVPVERMEPEELREPIVDALRKVYDPELPVNIYDLGLIYGIDIAANGNCHIDMTLTAPACPVAGMMPVMVKNALEQVEGVGEVEVDLVWDPPWSQDKMSEEAMLQLGLM
jgi:FeS assembly SUF system protein